MAGIALLKQRQRPYISYGKQLQRLQLQRLQLQRLQLQRLQLQGWLQRLNRQELLRDSFRQQLRECLKSSRYYQGGLQ